MSAKVPPMQNAGGKVSVGNLFRQICKNEAVTTRSVSSRRRRRQSPFKENRPFPCHWPPVRREVGHQHVAALYWALVSQQEDLSENDQNYIAQLPLNRLAIWNSLNMLVLQIKVNKSLLQSTMVTMHYCVIQSGDMELCQCKTITQNQLKLQLTYEGVGAFAGTC